MDDKDRILKLENAILEKDKALKYAKQRLEIIQHFSSIVKEGIWESRLTVIRIKTALSLSDELGLKKD